MRAWLAGVFVIVAGASLGAAPPPSSVDLRDGSTPPAARPDAPGRPDEAPRQAPPSICCCRIYSHGWQYSWMAPPSCQQSNGTCVSPDHC